MDTRRDTGRYSVNVYRVADLVGKIWALPNSILGLVVALIGVAVGKLLQILGREAPEVVLDVGHNALQCHNNPLMIAGALCLGNVINYGCGCTVSRAGLHEYQHTIQAQWLGPFYIPLHLVAQVASLLTWPVVAWRGPSPVHGKANWLEIGPLSNPPRPWPWEFQTSVAR